VALTAPATWAVAGGLYTAPVQQVTVQLAALVLVEGALLLGWHLLDTDVGETNLQRGVYAALTVITYGVLWAVALAHGEGLAGIAFRLTLGVLVGYSVVEAAVRAGIKVNMKADDNILMHRAVKNDWRRKAKEDAIADNSAHFEIERAKRAARTEVEHERIRLLKQRVLEELPANVQSSTDQYRPGAPQITILEAQATRANRQRLSKQEALAATIELLRDDPNMSVREIAAQVNKAPATVSGCLRELEDRNEIARDNGTTIVLVD
jgi:transposase-like protein